MSNNSNSADLKLRNGSRVAVIGGGPAGSFFALAAFQMAAQLGLTVDLTIFERKDLTAPGPRGCNMCAGILSTRVIEGLASFGISLPPAVVMGRVRSYKVHWGSNSISIFPPEPTRKVISVYRAGGPRKSSYTPASGFDPFLQSEVQARGARIVRDRVEEISLDSVPSVRTSGHTAVFDLIVLATGVNASPPIFRNHDYAPPLTETMAQDALLIRTETSRAEMDSTVHIYFQEPRELIFGALIPKGHFVTVSLVGQRLAPDSLRRFLTLESVTGVVGMDAPQMCGCRPRVAVRPARGFYADHFVAIGDACVSRLYKDGIGSALATARAAAETALRYGVTREAFGAHYAPLCRAIARDNQFGRAVFNLTTRSKRNGLFMHALAQALACEARGISKPPVLNQILWSLFSGDSSYREIFLKMLSPRTVARIAKSTIQECLSFVS